MVRYLGGDQTLIAEINRNAAAQDALPENNIGKLFGATVAASEAEDDKWEAEDDNSGAEDDKCEAEDDTLEAEDENIGSQRRYIGSRRRE